MDHKRTLSLMTLFLPRENIFFIEEWLKFHIAIGFNHFYLYNNMGSRWIDWGNNIKVNNKNKRGESIYALLADKTDAEVQEAFDEILKPFVKKGYVTQVMWQPKDEFGNITYAQEDAFIDYIKNYSGKSDWVCFTDLDEFIFPLTYDNIQDFIDGLDKNGYTYVNMAQKCFASRFTENNKPVKKVLEIYNCSDKIISGFGMKTIIRTDTLRLPLKNEEYNIHAPEVYGARSKYFYNPDIIRFNHYKFNKKELNWVRNTYNVEFRLNMTDKKIIHYYSRIKHLACLIN